MKILDSHKESVAVQPQSPAPQASLPVGQEGGEDQTGVCQVNFQFISTQSLRSYLPDIADNSLKFQQHPG